MAKKSKLPVIYFLGMVLVAVGFCLPMFKAEFFGAHYSNGFRFIDFDKSSFVTIGALLIFLGAVCGVVLSFLGGKSMDLLRLVSMIVSIVGGVILVIGFATNGGVYKAIGKGLLKHAFVGFYVVILGWIAALCGWVTKK